MKDKKIITSLTVLLICLLGGGYYFLSSNSKPNAKPVSIQQQEEEVIPTIVPSGLGLKMFLRSDKKAMKFEIENGKDISLIEYQISYTKEINGEEVPEGLIGEAKPEEGSSKISIDYREFGTCSRSVCRYDDVVSAVKLILKITKTDGKVFSTEDSLSL